MCLPGSLVEHLCMSVNHTGRADAEWQRRLWQRRYGPIYEPEFVVSGADELDANDDDREWGQWFVRRRLRQLEDRCDPDRQWQGIAFRICAMIVVVILAIIFELSLL